MTINISIISNYANKTVLINSLNGTLINSSSNNEVINLPYDSYILYISNPIQKTSITEIFNLIDNSLTSYFLFVFSLILLLLFYAFLQIIKNKGFKKGF